VPLEKRVAKAFMRRAKRGNDTNACDCDRTRHGAYVIIAAMAVQRARLRLARLLITMALASATAPLDTSIMRAQTTAARSTASGESFDQLYERGRRINASMKTLTARFTETTTSSLLVKPLVARGTLAVERPSRVVLNYTEPEPRVVLIDDNKMTVTWPTRQVLDVTSAMKRVQRYFVEGSAADLRRQFDIDDRQTTERPGTYRVLMTPKPKRIRETLDKLELWVDRESSLLAAMRMTFANGDTKLMTFDEVTPNAPLAAGIFALPR
jgi:outer membrane lipoprotein-sorting protein